MHQCAQLRWQRIALFRALTVLRPHVPASLDTFLDLRRLEAPITYRFGGSEPQYCSKIRATLAANGACVYASPRMRPGDMPSSPTKMYSAMVAVKLPIIVSLQRRTSGDLA